MYRMIPFVEHARRSEIIEMEKTLFPEVKEGREWEGRAVSQRSLGIGKILCVDCINVNVLVVTWYYRFARNDRRGTG